MHKAVGVVDVVVVVCAAAIMLRAHITRTHETGTDGRESHSGPHNLARARLSYFRRAASCIVKHAARERVLQTMC